MNERRRINKEHPKYAEYIAKCGNGFSAAEAELDAKTELASYLEIKSFSQFGSDLDASTLAILKHGEALMSVLKQNQYDVYQLDKQVFDLFVAKNKFLDDLNKDTVRPTLDEAYNVFKATHQDVLDNINKNKQISDEDGDILLKEMQEFCENLNR